MKTIKCNLFLIVGHPYKGECENTITVPDDFKSAASVMNKAGWKKCGGTYGNIPRWGYFCPEHADNNQFIQKEVIPCQKKD